MWAGQVDSSVMAAEQQDAVERQAAVKGEMESSGAGIVAARQNAAEQQ